MAASNSAQYTQRTRPVVRTAPCAPQATPAAPPLARKHGVPACSPCLLVTNHEGQLFPVVRPKGAAKRAKHGALFFDRILCDVPCSGDGTLRKAPDIWRRWTAANGNALHPLQLKITLQACRLLKARARWPLWGGGFALAHVIFEDFP